VLTHVIRDACRLIGPDRKPLVLPPLRFAFGADPSCAFPSTADGSRADRRGGRLGRGGRVPKGGDRDASPWNEELCGAAARDLRVSRGLHMFLVHLSAIDLDFHPVRSRSAAGSRRS